MTNIEKSQTFIITPDKCFEALLRALKSLHIEIHSPNSTDKTVVARWSGGMGAKFTIQAQCVSEGESSTKVHIAYRRDLTPAMFRPMGATLPPEFDLRINQILDVLSKHLNPSADTSSITENMERELSDKKRATVKRLLVIALLSILTGAIFGFLAGGFSIHGFNTFFMTTLIAWVVYALIARAINK